MASKDGNKSPRKTANSAVRRNAKGGVYVNPNELKLAFEFLDTNKKGYITAQDLREKLGIFYKNLSSRDYKLLMQGKTELTEQDLYALLSQNELSEFDPVKEAFKVYAPDAAATGAATAAVDRGVLRSILSASGFQGITEHDIETLVEALDLDGDHEVGLADFRELVSSAGKAKTQAQLMQQQQVAQQQRQQQIAHSPPSKPRAVPGPK